MRIAWFSSILTSALLRSSEFSRTVLKYVPKDWDVEVFVDDVDLEELKEKRLYDFKVFHYLRAYLRDKENPFDVFIYQLEDNELCSFCLQSLRVYGGISYMHDISFNRIEMGYYKEDTTGDRLNEKMEELYGKNSVKLGDVLTKGWPIEAYDRIYPSGREDWSNNTAIILFERRLIEIIKDKVGAEVIASTNFSLEPYGEEKIESSRERVREKLNLGEEEFIVTFSGERPVEDRILETILGFKKFLVRFLNDNNDSKYQLARLLWVVNSSEGLKVSKDIIKELREKKDKVVDYIILLRVTSVSELKDILLSSDSFVGLHSHEFHGVLLCSYLSLSFGVPCVLSGIEDDTTFPINVLSSINIASDESEALSNELYKLATSSKYHSFIKKNSLDFAKNYSSPLFVIKDLESVFSEYMTRIKVDRKKRFLKYKEEEKRYTEALKGEVSKDILGVQKRMFEKAFLDFHWEDGE